MKYRAEVDGLRSVAVLPVILFHAGFEHFSGGFVGVDIFFVISGYLITSIILTEKEKGTFSLINFYDRRARRILPALFLVMLISLPFSWYWLFPADMKDFSQSLIAVSTFSSNILFWQETGYWGVENELKPLLHTWSLAVEEQYYFIFPLFLMLMWPLRKRWILCSFVVIAVVSLIVAQWGAHNKPSASFFLLPTRFWELAIGACLAFYFVYQKTNSYPLLTHKFTTEIMGIVGILLIAYSIFVFDETVPFPSLFALVPTIGTGLIILFASENTLVGRLLGSKIPVAIGLVSYSAYLWHQPLFAFARHRSLTEPSDLLFTTLALMSFVCAYLSWRYVEKPFRTKGVISRKQLFTFSLVGSLMFMGFGIAGSVTNGFEFKSQITQAFIEQKLKANHGLSETCENRFTLSPECRTANQPEILVWGDSYAMHLVSGIVASTTNPKIIQMTKSVCGPFFNVAPVSKDFPTRWAEGCLKFTEQVRNWIKENNSLKYVVLSAHFNSYLSEQNKLLSRNGQLEATSMERVTREFMDTLTELESMGVTPVVFSPVPVNGADLGRCLAKANWIGINLDKCDFASAQLTQARQVEYRFLENINKAHRVVNLKDLLCDDINCKTHIDSTWLFRDRGHLSHEGSTALGEIYGFYNLIAGENVYSHNAIKKDL